MNLKEISQSVGTRRVRVVDEESGEEIGCGILKWVRYESGQFGGRDISEIVIAADLPEGT